jgi:uncharacterized protein with beta-barrel porin domain
LAVCTPTAPINNAVVTCTGATNNQNPPNGYGNNADVGNTITVLSGASVNGVNGGIGFSTGAVFNYGAISATFNGINAFTSANVTNYGTISVGSVGIYAPTLDLTNSGTISASNSGIQGTTANVTNAGTISGTNSCISVTIANVSNSGIISSGNLGINASNTANVTNSGSITGGSNGIRATTTANVTNSGTISSGDLGIYAGGTANVTNSGTITGSNYGIFTNNANVTNSGAIAGNTFDGISTTNANVNNSGTISGVRNGISVATANVANSGKISGGQLGISINTGNVTNSGTIIGGNGTAIRFTGASLSDTLTVLPGARFGGLVNFGGGADRVKFGPGNWILYTANFNAALSNITTSGNPFWVTPNSIVVAEISNFGAINRAMLDITGWISSMLPDSPVFEPSTNPAASAFAAIQLVSPQIEEAFASFPSALPYAPTTPVFKGGAVSDGAGNAFWAKGFAGRREQDTTGNFLGAITKGFGGAIGYDHRFNPAFQLGGFVGMSNNQADMNLNAGSVDIDTAFGGVYARTLFGPAFLDLSFIGGQLDNSSKRNIGGGLNLETASADYDGWFVNPAAALGYRYAIANGVTLTPALKVRYLKSQFDGYTETGSSTNLTVSGWDSAVFEERAEVSLASVQYFGGDSRILFRMTGGALAQQRQGDSNIGLTFSGQSLFAVAPDQRRVNGWYGGAGFDWQKGQFAVFASGEITDTSDSAVTYSAKGGLRMVW